MRWEPYAPEKCRADAERRAGKSELGYLYRFDWVSYSVSDEYGEHAYSCGQLELDAYRIHKRTPCGWTLDLWSGARRRFVSEHTYKRFALPTIEEALQSFVKRKQRQIRIYKARIAEAERGIEAAKLPCNHTGLPGGACENCMNTGLVPA